MYLQLFSRFLSSPRSIGSIVPSSKYLVRTLVKPIVWDNVRTVMELGGGTGVVTKEIAKCVRPDTKVIVFEKDSILSGQLQQQFPQFQHAQEAEQIQAVLHKENIASVDAIISSLPFANFSSVWTNQLLRRANQVLSDEGVFVQYQYSLQLRKTLSVYFSQVDVKFVPINIPPSFVYVCQKEKEKGN